MGDRSALVIQNGLAQQLALHDWPEITDGDINRSAGISGIKRRIEGRAHASVRHCVNDSAMHDPVRIEMSVINRQQKRAATVALLFYSQPDEISKWMIHALSRRCLNEPVDRQMAWGVEDDAHRAEAAPDRHGRNVRRNREIRG